MRNTVKIGASSLCGSVHCAWRDGLVSTLLRPVVAVFVLVFCQQISAFEPNAKAMPAKPTTIKVMGTWNGSHAITALIQRYESQQKKHFMTFTPVVTTQVPEMLFSHQCDIGMTLDLRLPETNRNTFAQLECFPVGRFVVGIAVNAKNRTKNLTCEELRDIFFRRITSWDHVAGAGIVTPIELCPRSAKSTAGMIFREIVLLRSPPGQRLLEASATTDSDKKSDKEVLKAAREQTSAIGFFLYEAPAELDKHVRLLRIAKDKDSEPVAPTVETVADGSYPLTDTLVLSLHPDASPEAKDFCKFVASRVPCSKLAVGMLGS